jgi:hypothetical protein
MKSNASALSPQNPTLTLVAETVVESKMQYCIRFSHDRIKQQSSSLIMCQSHVTLAVI